MNADFVDCTLVSGYDSWFVIYWIAFAFTFAMANKTQ